MIMTDSRSDASATLFLLSRGSCRPQRARVCSNWLARYIVAFQTADARSRGLTRGIVHQILRDSDSEVVYRSIMALGNLVS